MQIRSIILAAALAITLAPGASHANATVTLPASDNYGYLPTDLVVASGAEVTFLNLDPVASPDGAPHNVISRLFRTDKNRPWCVNFPGTAKCPLLYTPLISALETAPVQGVADLTPGVEYEFYCTLHSRMVGTITVLA